MKGASWTVCACYLIVAAGIAHSQNQQHLPIIDVHVHSMSLSLFGGKVNCGGDLQEFAPRDALEKFTVDDVRSACNLGFVAPATDAMLQAAVLKNLEDLNVTGVVSGAGLETTERWKAQAPSKIIPAILLIQPGNPSVEQLREAIKTGRLKVIGEVITQYQGIGPDDPSMEPYFALAEEFDVPIAVHVGLGAPAAAYVGQTNYLASLTHPFLLEPVLRRHPRLRINVMHAGWPMLDEMILMMYAHPQIYVDTGIIDWGIPRKEFYTYLKRLVEAGFGNRIMYGSDEMIWPAAMAKSIEAIESAAFLSEKQKRDILYNNAARFLRLGPTGKH